MRVYFLLVFIGKQHAFNSNSPKLVSNWLDPLHVCSFLTCFHSWMTCNLIPLACLDLKLSLIIHRSTFNSISWSERHTLSFNLPKLVSIWLDHRNWIKLDDLNARLIQLVFNWTRACHMHSMFWLIGIRLKLELSILKHACF